MKTLFDSDVRYYGGGMYNTYAIKNGIVHVYSEALNRWISTLISPWSVEVAFSSCEVPDEWRSTLEAS